MEDVQAAKAPVHLWIVGLLSLIWNAFGCTDYLMTRMRSEEWMAQSGGDPKAMLAWIDAFPFYAQFGWGLGVWMGLAGSILLLMRHRWAVWAYALSLLGAVLGLGYQIALAPPLPGAHETPMMKAIPYIVIVIAIALFLYARAQEKKGVLR